MIQKIGVGHRIVLGGFSVSTITRIGALVLLATATSACAAAADAELAPGWVLLAVEVVKPDGEHFDPTEQDVLSGFTIKGIPAGKLYRTVLPRYRFELFEVAPGDYCVNDVRTYSNQDLPICTAREPFGDRGKEEYVARFEVHAGEVVNLGEWSVIVDYQVDRDRVRYRLYNSYQMQRGLAAVARDKLDAELLARIAAAHPPATDRAALTTGWWYHVTDTAGLEDVRFLADGTFERHAVAAKGDTVEGKWRWDGDELVLEFGDYATVRARMVDGAIRGEWRNKRGLRYEWAAGRDPFQPAGLEPGSVPRLVGSRDVTRPTELPTPLPPGKVVARIKLPPSDWTRVGFRALTVPHVAEFISSEPPGLYDELVKRAIRGRIYTPIVVEGRSLGTEWVETFEFPAAHDAIRFEAPKR